MTTPRSRFSLPALDVIRGALIGVAEVIPGVSGGTIALITGVYHTLIGSASSIVRALAGTVTKATRVPGWRAVAALPWWRLVAIGLGMVSAVIVAARVVEPLIVTYPEATRALFFGLILASVSVPLMMVGSPLRTREWLLVVLATALTFWLMGFPPLAASDPSKWWVFFSAALAICALVLPGVSGSFLLLTIGLYQPTIAAVNDRDWAYLGVFALGALVGLSSFVVGLEWLLAHRRRVTLVVMAGLMLGSLRALWPWQTPERVLLAPAPEEFWPLVGLCAAGLATVVALILIEQRVLARHP